MWEKWSSCRETRKTIGEDGALDAMENPRLKWRFGTVRSQKRPFMKMVLQWRLLQHAGSQDYEMISKDSNKCEIELAWPHRTSCVCNVCQMWRSLANQAFGALETARQTLSSVYHWAWLCLSHCCFSLVLPSWNKKVCESKFCFMGAPS